VIGVAPIDAVLGKTVVIWWFPDWQGVAWFRWQEPLDQTYTWSLVLGWLELRRLR
jgi:hypothetical protein